MRREQPFDLPHKGLRVALAELTAAASGTNFEDHEDCIALENLFHDVWELIANHSAEEERVTFSELEQKAPGSIAPFLSEHRSLDASFEALKNAVQTQKYRLSAEKFTADLNRFSAAFQTHMNREEDELQPLIWKHFTDDELAAHRRTIMAASGPELLLKWFRFVFYALTDKQSTEFLARLETMFPLPAFSEATKLAAAASKRRQTRL